MLTGFMAQSANLRLLGLSLGRKRGPLVMLTFSMYSLIACMALVARVGGLTGNELGVRGIGYGDR